MIFQIMSTIAVIFSLLKIMAKRKLFFSFR